MKIRKTSLTVPLSIANDIIKLKNNGTIVYYMIYCLLPYCEYIYIYIKKFISKHLDTHYPKYKLVSFS